MTDAPKHIRVVSDGRPGHENQSSGLAAAICRRTGASVETVRVGNGAWLWSRCRNSARAGLARPDLLIGAGHKVHLPLWYAAQKFKAKSVIIMKPTWPVSFFDLCFIPRHDLNAGGLSPRVVTIRGALNRIPEDIPVKQGRGLVLIGGPSRNHGWAAVPLAGALAAVIRTRPELAWTVADSPRTPPGFLRQLADVGVPGEFVSHSTTTPEWLPAQLLAAEEAWVTEDSVSMIFESVTAGARTGLLPAPALRPDGDVQRAVQNIIQDGFATGYEFWLKGGRHLPPSKRLHETARCAEVVLARLFGAPSNL